MWPSTSPGCVKFYDRTKSCYDTGGSKANYIAMRYSDVLLNYAEVENYLNGPTEDAYSKLNAVHCRKRSIPTHSERLNPPTIIAKMALKSA